MTLRATSHARRSVTGALATMALAATMIAGGTLVAPAATASTAPHAAGSAIGAHGALVSTRSYSKSTVAKHNKASDCWTHRRRQGLQPDQVRGQAPGRAQADHPHVRSRCLRGLPRSAQQWQPCQHGRPQALQDRHPPLAADRREARSSSGRRGPPQVPSRTTLPLSCGASGARPHGTREVARSCASS